MLGWDADKLHCSGSVDSEGAKTSIMDALKAAFGADTACELGVDANTNTPNWASKLAEFLPLLKMNGVKLGLDGDEVTLEGANLPAEGLNALVEKLKALFGDKFKSMAAAAVAAAPVPSPVAATPDAAPVTEDAGKKLEAMAAAGSVGGQDLVNALNMATLNFASGSAAISRDSLVILRKAAAAIKKADPGTKIEVGGHTDNVGGSTVNMKLSEARAHSVVRELVKMGVDAGMLTAAGYGDTKPRADNDTPGGRAMNRRMEFTLM
jgi:outer membrane protein OmpA-like peptidoglycan-associated protein